MTRLGQAIAFVTSLVLSGSAAFASPIKRDEEVIFFPTSAYLNPAGDHWVVPLHAWVFEREEDSLWRRGAFRVFAQGLGLTEDDVGSLIFRQRALMFLVDNERGKRFKTTLSAGDSLGPTAPSGHVEQDILLARRGAGAEPGSFWLEYSAVLPPGDGRSFAGETLLPATEGLSVISDIDDTIKISEVTDKSALLANSFLKPFAEAPGMAEAYRRLAAADAVFHYVSSSPWQLYPALREFMDLLRFPRGSFHLKSFRAKDESFFNLFKSSQETKPPVIEALLAAHPQRRFILIGDSGEVDPEIYGAVARQHPERIARIFIRNVTGEAADNARFSAAFAGLPESLWTLFEDAVVIEPTD